MKRISIAITILTVSAQAFLPTSAAARQVDEPQMTVPRQVESQSSIGAAQGPTAPPRSSAGEQLLRNALIGAAVGATAAGALSYAVGDCGDCSADNVKAILSGAMYGALIGAAIRVHPSRRPGHPSRRPTFNPHLTKHVKAMNVVVRF